MGRSRIPLSLAWWRPFKLDCFPGEKPAFQNSPRRKGMPHCARSFPGGGVPKGNTDKAWTHLPRFPRDC